MKRTPSLPQDCWMTVLQYVSFEDRLSMSKTCKDLYVSAIPFLYRKISWDWVIPPLRRVLRLLRTIVSRPDLAALVREVRIQSSVCPWSKHRSPVGNVDWGSNWAGPWEVPRHNVDWAQEQPLFEDVVQKGTDIIHQAQFPEADEWSQALYNGNAYAYVAVLIFQLPDIRTLKLDYSFVWMGGYPGRMVKHCLLARNNGAVSNTFDALQSVDYGGNVPPPEHFELVDPTPDGFPLSYNQDQFIGWFHLPSIQHLSIWLRDTIDLRTNPNLHLDARTMHLDSLVLARSTISEEDVLFLLRCIPKLRKLHLGLAYPWFGGLIFKRGELLIQALELFHDSMEVLSLGLDYYPCGFGELHGDRRHEELWDPFYRILKMFTNLQKAEVPAEVLLGFDPWESVEKTNLSDVLPSTLHELVIRDDMVAVGDWEEPFIYDHVLAFLPRWRTSTPLLQQITLRLWDGHYEQMFADDEKEVYLACDQAGIPFKVITDSHSSALWAYSG